MDDCHHRARHHWCAALARTGTDQWQSQRAISARITAACIGGTPLAATTDCSALRVAPISARPLRALNRVISDARPALVHAGESRYL